MRRVLLAAGAVVLLAACNGTPAEMSEPLSEAVPSAEVPSASTSPCGQSLLDAVEAAEDSGGTAELSGAFQACESLEDFQTAAGQQSGALGEQDPQEYVEEQCAGDAAVADAALCTSLG